MSYDILANQLQAWRLRSRLWPRVRAAGPNRKPPASLLYKPDGNSPPEFGRSRNSEGGPQKRECRTPEGPSAAKTRSRMSRGTAGFRDKGPGVGRIGPRRAARVRSPPDPVVTPSLYYKHATTSFPRRCFRFSPLSRDRRVRVDCRLRGVLTFGFCLLTFDLRVRRALWYLGHA
jgi:hypothetical protein